MFNSTDFLGGKFIERLSSAEYNQYWAHSRKNEKETLYEHSQLVAQYGNALMDAHQLNDVVDCLVCEFVLLNYEKSNQINAIDYIKNLFYSTLGYHDAGKINPNFQFVKMNNNSFAKKINSLGSDHAKIGTYTFILDFLRLANNGQFTNPAKIINVFLLLGFSYVIQKHHAPKIEYKNDFDFEEGFIDDVFELIKLYGADSFSKQQQKTSVKNLNKNFLSKLHEYIKSEKPFALFALLKQNYSLLTASDYMATTHYMDDWKTIPVDFGIFSTDLKKKIVYNVENKESYNKKTYDELAEYRIEFPTEQSNKNLNKLRQNLSVEIINGIRENIDKHLFYIEAPTGGGKTNLSMLALAEFLRNDLQTGINSVNKVFYVFPFTTLITQTFKSLKNTLGLEDDEILQLHSKSGFSSKDTEQYGDVKENIIDYQFLNYPISLISHIRFFDILKSNRKSTNYILHRLANSVVIIDELQTYSPKQWDKVIFFINNYARLFNMRFILMSATLPKIEKLLSKESDIEKSTYEAFVYLNSHKHQYFTNPNFKNRVEIDYSLLDDIDFKQMPDEDKLPLLWQKVNEYSSSYLDNGNRRVHTIIEFIFKKTASSFIETAMSENSLFDEIFILSGTILEPRRREIIEKLKSVEYANKNILLIATQVVEAGVDIDMDVGFKDTSLIDSDEQLAGRINRNANKPMCKLFLFNLDDANIIYGNDDRFKKQQLELKAEYKEILNTKNFDKVYNCVMEYRNQVNNQQGGFINLSSYKMSMLKLDFKTVDTDFKLIDNSYATETLFIPINIPINIPLSTTKNFGKKELMFLIDHGKLRTEDDFVSGENIWQLYAEIIQNQHRDFSSQKIQKIILQGLISKFSISVSTFSTEFKNAVTLGAVEERFGFYYLHQVDDVYSYKQGFKACNVDTAIIF